MKITLDFSGFYLDFIRFVAKFYVNLDYADFLVENSQVLGQFVVERKVVEVKGRHFIDLYDI